MKTKRKCWSKEEVDLLKDLYVNKGLCALEISKIMNRTYVSVHIKRKKLKLKHTKEQTTAIKSRLNCGTNNAMSGIKAWSNGLTKYTDVRLKEAGIKNSKTRIKMFVDGLLPNSSGSKNGMYGKKAWSNGLTKDTDERVMNSSIKNSISKKILWNSYSEEEKEKRRIIWARAGLKCNKKDTSIEIKVEDYLNEIGILYKKQHQIGRFRCDFYIPDVNLVIECLGDYWHVNPKKYNIENVQALTSPQRGNLIRDKKKKIYLKENDFSSLFFWEHDINNNFDIVCNEIRNKCLMEDWIYDFLYFCS